MELKNSEMIQLAQAYIEIDGQIYLVFYIPSMKRAYLAKEHSPVDTAPIVHEEIGSSFILGDMGVMVDVVEGPDLLVQP